MLSPNIYTLTKHLRHIIFDLTLQLQKRLFIMSRDNSPSSSSFQPLQPLRALEPRRMISRQPTLRNPVSPIFDDMTMIRNEEEGSILWQVELHSH